MTWNPLTDTIQLEEIKKESQQYPVLIFKHSTRCSISATALSRFERNWKSEDIGDLKPYYLDLISYRSLSNQVAETFDVEHESPQALIIRNGESIFDASHYDISFDEIKAQMVQFI